MHAHVARSMLLLGGLALLLGGCWSSAPTRLYLLTALADAERVPPRAGAAGPLILGVGPVTLPRYLDRPQIATRAGPHELRLGEFDQWAEPLQENVTRVLAENLARGLGTEEVLRHPWPRAAPVAYQVVVEVTRFDSTMGAESVLTARWQLVDVQANRELWRQTSHVQVPIEESEYEAIVAAMSRGLADLSQEIALALRTLSRS